MHTKCQNEIQQQQALIIQLQEDLVDKNKRISELSGLLDKYQSVFNQSPSLSTPVTVIKGQIQPQQSRERQLGLNDVVFGFGGNDQSHVHDPTVQTRKRGIVVLFREGTFVDCMNDSNYTVEHAKFILINSDNHKK
ncbi:unnamed protein product [Schistosoma mattheei]|uniref:Uncharacterized protein n=1 Tax=Schistosoma mattheei TaxID=31246 RepID=A0A183PPZ2_9TREM|nr:unnamed protein product [Schistosoma mattheei]